MPRPRPILAVLIGIAIIMVDGFDLQVIGFVAPEIARGWAQPIADFGPVFSAGLAGSVLGAVLAGSAVRAVGGRMVLVGALVLFGVGTLCTAWVRDLTTLTALRAVVGIGVGGAVPVVISLVARNSPARLRATIVALTSCGQPAGAALGAALCAHYIPRLGWPFAFYLGGVLPLVLAMIVAPFRSLTGEPSWQGAAPVMREPRAARVRELFHAEFLSMTVLLWVCCVLSVFFVYIIVNWLPSAVRAAGHSLESSALAISLFNMGGIAGALLISNLIDRHGPWKVLPLSFGLAAFSMALLGASDAAPHLMLPATFAAGFTGYGAVISLGALVILLYPHALHTAGMGWALGVGRLGAAIGPLGAGFALAAGLAIGHLFYISGLAALLVALGLLGLARTTHGLGDVQEHWKRSGAQPASKL